MKIFSVRCVHQVEENSPRSSRASAVECHFQNQSTSCMFVRVEHVLHFQASNSVQALGTEKVPFSAWNSIYCFTLRPPGSTLTSSPPKKTGQVSRPRDSALARVPLPPERGGLSRVHEDHRQGVHRDADGRHRPGRDGHGEIEIAVLRLRSVCLAGTRAPSPRHPNSGPPDAPKYLLDDCFPDLRVLPCRAPLYRAHRVASSCQMVNHDGGWEYRRRRSHLPLV